MCPVGFSVGDKAFFPDLDTLLATPTGPGLSHVRMALARYVFSTESSNLLVIAFRVGLCSNVFVFPLSFPMLLSVFIDPILRPIQQHILTLKRYFTSIIMIIFYIIIFWKGFNDTLRKRKCSSFLKYRCPFVLKYSATDAGISHRVRTGQRPIPAITIVNWFNRFIHSRCIYIAVVCSFDMMRMMPGLVISLKVLGQVACMAKERRQG